MAYSQNDPRWKNSNLGYGTAKIGPYGCYLTADTNIANKFGHDINVIDMNARIVSVGGFVDYDMLMDKSLSMAFPDIQLIDVQTWYGVDANLDFFNDASDPTIGTILMIDSRPLTSAVDTHFMAVVQRQGDDVLVDDSWDGVRKLVSAYGRRPADNIFKGIKYRVNKPKEEEVLELQPPVFNESYYLAANPDITGWKAADHWLKWGISEGRKSAPNFSVQEYIANYPDLKASIGNNWKDGVWHYFTYGINEGRFGTKALFDAAQQSSSLQTEIASLKVELDKAKTSNGSFTEADRAAAQETNSLIKQLVSWFKSIFKIGA